MPDPGETQRVSAALLALARRMDDIFRLPAGNAPGVHLVGALASLGAFALPGHGEGRLSAGGRGLSQDDALITCMGEMAEALSVRERGMDPLIIPHAVADREPLDRSVDGDWLAGGLGLAGASALADLPLDRTRARRLTDGETVLVPSELVLRRVTDRRLAPRRPDANGTAAGPSLAAATARALLELVERDAIALWWYGGNDARRLEPAAWASPGFAETVGRARRPPTARRFWLLDITADIAVPVVACCSSDADGGAVVAGFAADPDIGAAASRAFLEMCQMEVAQDLALLKLRGMDPAAAPAADRVWADRARTLGTAAYPRFVGDTSAAPRRFPAPPEAGDALGWIAERLAERGFVAHAVDLTRETLGVPVVRALVPGLQGTRPDWVTRRLTACAEARNVDYRGRLRSVAPI